jgi:hypothetical protein
MRNLGTLHPTDGTPLPPDTVKTFLMTGGSSAQASDWETSTGAVANAAAAAVHVIRITPATTAGGQFFANVNLYSGAAAVPASGTSVSSAGVSHPVMAPTMFQVPGNSTGYSIAAYTSGTVQVEMWRK